MNHQVAQFFRRGQWGVPKRFGGETVIPSQKIVNHRSTIWRLALIAILVVLVRGVVFLFDTTQADIAYDVDCYLEIARNVVSGRGYSLLHYSTSAEPVATAMRGPTAVYFLAAVLWLLGDHTWSIVIAQWLVDAGTAIILFFIAMEIFQDRRVAFVTSMLFAFYEPGLIFTFRGWSEPVFTLVLAGFTLSFLRALREPSSWRYALCGFLLGLAVLTRPVMQFYPLVILPLLSWALKQRWLLVIPGFAIFSLAFIAVVSPWMVRNYVVFNAFKVSSYSGEPFFEGNFPLDQPDYLRHRGTEDASVPLQRAFEARFGPTPHNLDLPHYTKAQLKKLDPSGNYAKFKGFNEFEIDQLAFQEGLKAVRTHPGRYVVLSIVRLLRVWFDHRFVTYVIVGGKLPRASLVAAINATLLGLAVAAFVWFRASWLRPAVVSLIVLVGYNTAIYAATNAVGRYSVPIMPYVMVFAAFTIVQLLPKWSKDLIPQ